MLSERAYVSTSLDRVFMEIYSVCVWRVAEIDEGSSST